MVGGFVRLMVGALLGLMLAGQLAAAQNTELRGFSWSNNARFTLNLVHDGRSEVINGELRNNGTAVAPGSKQGLTAEIKSYVADYLFTIVIVTSETSENAAMFLLERPQEKWIVMNARGKAIVTRKVDAMKDYEGVIQTFKKLTNFNVPQSLRKMVEYFEKYPNKRLQNLYAELEAIPNSPDQFLAQLPKPRTSPESNDQGVIPGHTPEVREARQKQREQVYNRETGQFEDPPPEQPRRGREPALQPGDEGYEEYMLAREQQRRRRAEERRRQQMRERSPYDIYPERPYPPRGGYGFPDMFGGRGGGGYPQPPRQPGGWW